MSNEFNFDRSYWYSGCDGTYWAELLPAHSGYWFVVVLGQGYLATSAMPHPQKSIITFLVKHGFTFEQATWESVESGSFTQNPFLSGLPAYRAIAACQTGKHQLPQKPIVVEFGQRPDLKPKARNKSQVFFAITSDRQYLYIGVASDPHTSLHKLQTTYPQTLSLLGHLPNRRKLGQTIRQQFNYLNTQGSWFQYSQELQTYIASLLTT
jgi:hypothetical protein